MASRRLPGGVCSVFLSEYRISARPERSILKVIKRIRIQVSRMPILFGIFSMKEERKGYKTTSSKKSVLNYIAGDVELNVKYGSAENQTV